MANIFIGFVHSRNLHVLSLLLDVSPFYMKRLYCQHFLSRHCFFTRKKSSVNRICFSWKNNNVTSVASSHMKNADDGIPGGFKELVLPSILFVMIEYLSYFALNFFYLDEFSYLDFYRLILIFTCFLSTREAF